jgi:hypothetical protein
MKHLPKLLRVAGLTVALMALWAPSAPAAVAPGYEEFTGCPDRNVDANVRFCVASVVTGGHLQMGTKDTPITDPITLVGATTLTGGFVVGHFDGGRQQVPGGLVGLTGLDWLTDVLGGDALKVYARTELAGNATNPVGDPVSLPIKVKLENPTLGDSCYIGSDSNPITLVLTRGTTNPPPPNEPITGSLGTRSTDPNLPGVVRDSDLVLVDNAFAAPAAQGCRLRLGLLNVSIDTLVNLQSGLPSPPGTNEAVQEADGATVSVRTVYPPFGFDPPQ